MFGEMTFTLHRDMNVILLDPTKYIINVYQIKEDM